MLRSFLRASAAAAVAAASVVVLAAPAAAENCVTVDRDPVLCAGADAVPAVDQSNGGATVSVVVDVDVCSSLATLPTCDRAGATLTIGSTGLTGIWLSTRPYGGNVVHVPEVCVNTQCVGPVDYPLPVVDGPCVATGLPMLIVDGREVVRFEILGGTC